MKLPPLNALKAFEAAARHGGYVGAADELHVSRGAVSRHVKVLEDHLGTQLFRRNHKGVELTDAGKRLLPALTRAFGLISEETTRLITDAAELRVICPPSISIRWLFPRLGQFRERHPDIKLRLTTDFYGEQGFDSAEFDLGLSLEHWPGRAPDIMTLPLFPMRIAPACAPELLRGAEGVNAPEDLGRLTLLHENSARADWATWAKLFGIAGIDTARGEIFPNLDMATKAAVLGSGVVMADLILCRDEIEQNRLVLPFPDMSCETPHGRYALIGSKSRWEEPKVRAFKKWIAAQASDESPTT